MPRLIIEYDDDIGPANALRHVLAVVQEGRVSQAAGIPHYCWATRFIHAWVLTRRKHSATAADSFLVHNRE